MKILLADDHVLFRDVLTHYFERFLPEAEIVSVSDMHEAMATLQACDDIDLILLDLQMPGMRGLEGLKKVKLHDPQMKVALLSGVAERIDVEEALALGAAGYLPKTLSGSRLVKGVEDILAGVPFVPVDHEDSVPLPSYYGDQEHCVVSSAGLDMPEPKGKLTPRETEVLSYLMRGESNKEIARDLDLQVVTVKLHVRSICRKLGAKNRTQAALIAQKIRG